MWLEEVFASFEYILDVVEADSVEHQICDQQAMGLSRSWILLCNNFGQVTYTDVSVTVQYNLVLEINRQTMMH